LTLAATSSQATEEEEEEEGSDYNRPKEDPSSPIRPARVAVIVAVGIVTVVIDVSALQDSHDMSWLDADGGEIGWYE